MANEERSDSQQEQEVYQQRAEEDDKRKEEEDSDAESDDSSSSDDYLEEGSDTETLTYSRPGEEPPELNSNPETNIKKFTRVLESKRMQKLQEEEDSSYVPFEDLWNFPEDPENWREEDLKELWGDAPLEMTKPGWDPAWVDEEELEVVKEELKAGRDPPIAPFYVPYRKYYPAIPDNHHDISNPKAVIEELDRIEEFLNWVSYVFEDGSTYEGTVWDDLAQGKGVYVAEHGLVRYEGEWLRNDMDGHGVVEVDIPDIEPVPGSKLEAKMRAEGKIIKRDYMSPEDREWLEMDIEDCIAFTDGQYEVPLHERDEWIKLFGRKPEKGRYRYAGQWKQGRMHGCGVYEVNERMIYGRFYFGELLDDLEGCDENISAMHAGLAEVAAAKARMFVNKPDGMVREERGPYGDPSHPYFYEEEDAWMAPGFINQFYEVPDYWKTYVHEVDQEREMWLNSFYKAPLRLPMPAELEYWWSKDETPEFVLLNKEPERDPQDPSKLIYTEDPLILHTPTGRLINYIEDEKYGVRLFWQPLLKEGEDVDPKKAQFLPLGYDEFFGQEVIQKKDNIWKRLVMLIENALKPAFDKLEKWTEENKKATEMKLKLIEKELELVEAEICLEEAIEDMDEELKKREKEEENRMETVLPEEEASVASRQEDKAVSKEDVDDDEDEDEDEEEEEDELTPTSFGSATSDHEESKNDQNGNKPRGSPFSSSSLSFASCSLVSAVPSTLQTSIAALKRGILPLKSAASSSDECLGSHCKTVDSVSFPRVLGRGRSLRAVMPDHQKFHHHSGGRMSRFHSLCRILSCPTTLHAESSSKVPRNQRCSLSQASRSSELGNVLSLHVPLNYLEPYTDTIKC